MCHHKNGQLSPIELFLSLRTCLFYLILLLGNPYLSVLAGPVISSNFPDPSLIKVNGSYYAFATANGNPPGIHVQVASSPDFYSWNLIRDHDAMPVSPKWATKHPHIWAPDINRRPDGTFIMYFSALSKRRTQKGHRHHHCVGVAMSKTVLGPYHSLDEPFSCDYDTGGSIDSNGFHDPVTGFDYVVFKVDGNSLGTHKRCSTDVAPTPLQLQRVNSTNLYSPIGQPTELLSNVWRDGPDIEAPSLVYHNGIHYLIFNSGCFASKKYKSIYAVSRHGILGPYHRQPRPLLLTGRRIDDTELVAPGGVDVDPSNSSKIVFHADTNLTWFKSNKNRIYRDRAMFAAELLFDGDGTLTARSLP